MDSHDWVDVITVIFLLGLMLVFYKDIYSEIAEIRQSIISNFEIKELEE